MAGSHPNNLWVARTWNKTFVWVSYYESSICPGYLDCWNPSYRDCSVRVFIIVNFTCTTFNTR